jgi:hypothetical protein
MSWGPLALRTQYQAFRNLPSNLRHRRIPILARILKTAVKAAESHVRHNYLQGLRNFFPRKTAQAAGPLPCPLTLSPTLRDSGARKQETSCSFGDAVVAACKTD